jgi:hypothetical protein
MFTLELYNKDSLYFGFPDIQNEVFEMASKEVDRAMERLLQEDRTLAFEAMLRRMRAWESRKLAAGYEVELPEGAIESARAMVPLITEEDILGEVIKLLPPLRPLDSHILLRRSLRAPESGRDSDIPWNIYEKFPMEMVDTHAERVPAQWMGRNGVMVPMTRGEALMINFTDFTPHYPCALKLSVGNINARTGKISHTGLESHPQNYFVLPDLKVLHSHLAAQNLVLQFKAPGHAWAPDKEGNSSELHFEIFPLLPALYVEEAITARLPTELSEIMNTIVGLEEPDSERYYRLHPEHAIDCAPEHTLTLSVGIVDAADISLGFYISEDPRPLSHYLTDGTRCFSIHMCNSKSWRAFTGSTPPPSPVTEALYKERRVPWYEEYQDPVS